MSKLPDNPRPALQARRGRNVRNTRGDTQPDAGNVHFLPHCTESLRDKLSASLAALAATRADTLASIEEMTHCVENDSEFAPPQQAAEILLALDRVRKIIDGLGDAPLSLSEENLSVLTETVRLLSKSVSQSTK